MEHRRGTRAAGAVVDENGLGPVKGKAVNAGPLKRSALGEPPAKAAVKGRGLAVRQPTALNARANAFAAGPPTKRRVEVEVEIQTPQNGPVSMECEMLTEDFVKEMKEYMYGLEEMYLVDEMFMSEKRVTTKMRSILVDWIVQVHHRFHLLAETLHLTIYLMDRYLEVSEVEKEELQLVGICSIIAACKYEETYCPELKDFEYITDNAYTRKQMIRMEQRVMKTAGFNFGRPHSIQFLRSYSQRCGLTDATMHCMAKYLSEMTLLDAPFSSIRPSTIAAASLWLADQLRSTNLPLKAAFEGVAEPAKFMKEAIKVGKMMASCVLRVRTVGKLMTITEKYASTKMCNVSEFSSTENSVLETIVINAHNDQ